jgi:hypothetical protein
MRRKITTFTTVCIFALLASYTHEISHLFSGSPIVHAQVPVPCMASGQYTATGVSATIDNRRTGCYQWRVSYNSTGFSGISVQLEYAPDNNGVPGSWSVFTGSVVTDGSNPSTSTNTATIGIHSNAAWVRLNLVTAIGSGALTYQIWGANSTSNFNQPVGAGGTTGATGPTGSGGTTGATGPTGAVSTVSIPCSDGNTSVVSQATFFPRVVACGNYPNFSTNISIDLSALPNGQYLLVDYLTIATNDDTGNFSYTVRYVDDSGHITVDQTSCNATTAVGPITLSGYAYAPSFPTGNYLKTNCGPDSQPLPPSSFYAQSFQSPTIEINLASWAGDGNLSYYYTLERLQ